MGDIMRKTLLMMAVAVITLIGFVETSSTQPFTFTSTNAADPVTNGVMTPDGMVGSVQLQSNGASDFADGTSEAWTSACLNFASTQTADDVNGYCITTMEGTGDILNVAHVCQNIGNAEDGNLNCWGVFAGGTGKYAKANGTITWRATSDGASGGGNLNTE